MRELLVSIPDYWEHAKRARTVLPPQNFEDLVERCGPGGYWKIEQINKYTGAIEKEIWAKNAITDNGALSLFKNTMNFSAGGIAVANIIVANQGVGWTTLNGTISSGGSPTSITVNSLTGPTIPNGTTLIVGAGTANTYTCTVNQVGGITGAGSVTVTAVGTATGAIATGANIQVVVGTGDVSSLSAPVAYTAALPTGQFSISGSGVGNRQMSVNNSGNYLFSTTSNSNPSVSPTANFTDAWLVNTSPVAATTQTFVHISFPAFIAVNSSSNGQATIIEKL